MPASDEQATRVLPATGEQPASAAGWASAGPAESGGEAAAPTADQPTVAGAQPTQAIQQPRPVRDLPAGIDPNELADAPIASARRGKLRRRLRYLRAVRDLLLRDLGGFTYEVQRTAGGTTQETHRRLIESKTNRIAALDTEVRGLESRLGEPHGGPLLREPGIGGTCPECGEIHASDAHYCSRCGAPLDAKARARRDAAVAAAAQPTTSSHATAEPAPASVLWAAGPRPETTPKAEDDEEEDTQPSLATSQWLALRPRAASENADEPAATADEPAAKADQPAAKADQPAAKADQPAATADQPPAETPRGDALTAEGPAAPGEPAAEETDVPAPATAAARRGSRAKADATGSARRAATEAAATDGPEAGDEAEPAKPKRPRASRAKKPAAGAEAATGAGEAATGGGGEAASGTEAATGAGEAATGAGREAASGTEAATGGAEATSAEDDPPKPKPKRTRAKKAAGEFAPEPNGRKDEPVAPPSDPLTSRQERGS